MKNEESTNFPLSGDDTQADSCGLQRRLLLRGIGSAPLMALIGGCGGGEVTEAGYDNYWANWDLCSVAGILAIGVFCDRTDLFNEAIEYYKNGRGNGAAAHNVYYLHPGHMGQFQESGRDQGHATLCIGLAGSLCEMAWNQGEDLYGHANNRFLAGAEYVAKSNLLDGSGRPYAVPFTTLANVTDPRTRVDTPGKGVWYYLVTAVSDRGESAPSDVVRAATFPELLADGREVGRNPQIELNPYQLGATSRNWLGRSQYGADPAFNGRMQDLLICSGALAAAEIQLLAT